MAERIYQSGTLKAVDRIKPRNKHSGREPYASFYSPTDKPYYKEGTAWHSIVDHQPARGYELPDGSFVPLDYWDLLSLTMVKELGKTEGMVIDPTDTRWRKYLPPPLLWVQNPSGKRPAWNRETIIRHLARKEEIKNHQHKKVRND